MMKYFIILSLLITGTASADIPLEGYTRLDRSFALKNLIEDPTFEKDGEGWQLSEGATVEKGSGRSATGALKYQRNNPSSYRMVSTKVKLTPGAFYRFGAWIKTENVTGKGATVALEFSGRNADGKRKYISGRYLKGPVGTHDWKLVSATVRVPKDADDASLLLYLGKGATGTAWFDDVILEEQNANSWAFYTLNPYNTIRDGKLTLAISHADRSTAGLLIRMELKGSSQIQTAPIRDRRAEFALELADGDYNAEFMVLDPARREVLYSTEIPLTVNRRSAPTVAVDQSGRCQVNGKPFMPIGIFTKDLDPDTVDTLQDAGFNCALPYGSMHLKTPGNLKSTPEQILKVMDTAATKGFKVIFSCKDVGSSSRYGLKSWHGAEGQDEIIRKITALLKDHPALLAWYVNDEQSVLEVRRLTSMRRLFNRLDPNHPTYGVLYQYEDLPLYGPTCDIIGVDPYPLGGNSLEKAVYAMSRVQFAGLPAWVVPQLSNIAIYRTDKQLEAPQNPSEEKMRSLVLLEASYGAKGFIFYKFEDLSSPKLPKDNFVREWAKTKQVTTMLKRLEPYIMSSHPVEILAKGPVMATRLRRDDGKAAVLICTTGSGPVSVTLNLPGNYRSLYNRTVKQGDSWLFSGKDISSDLLLEQ